MKLLTEDAVIVCKHELGIVAQDVTNSWVTVMARRVLVRPNPEQRPISGCPNIGLTIKPCQLTLSVRTGYSSWIRIDTRQICLDTVTGLTDGTPPGVVDYVVRAPGQLLVSERASGE